MEKIDYWEKSDIKRNLIIENNWILKKNLLILFSISKSLVVPLRVMNFVPSNFFPPTNSPGFIHWTTFLLFSRILSPYFWMTFVISFLYTKNLTVHFVSFNSFYRLHSLLLFQLKKKKFLTSHNIWTTKTRSEMRIFSYKPSRK